MVKRAQFMGIEAKNSGLSPEPCPSWRPGLAARLRRRLRPNARTAGRTARARSRRREPKSLSLSRLGLDLPTRILEP